MLRRPYGAACDVWGARHDPRRVPARPRRPKLTDHILAILSARDGHGRWSGPDQDHARRSTCLPGHCAALAWPWAAVVAVMAPVEGKNAQMTKSLSGSRTGPEGKIISDFRSLSHGFHAPVCPGMYGLGSSSSSYNKNIVSCMHIKATSEASQKVQR